MHSRRMWRGFSISWCIRSIPNAIFSCANSISNAADACEKLRHEALADPALTGDQSGFLITVALDKARRTLTVTDNGIGMSKEELASSLGTIARSGTRAFLEKLRRGCEGGCAGRRRSHRPVRHRLLFGLHGRRSDRCRVAPRGTDEAYRWCSDGKGSFSIAPLPLEEAPARGTRVILHLERGERRLSRALSGREDPARLFERHRGADRTRRAGEARRTSRKSSGEKPNAPRRITDGSALWTKPKSAVSDDEYTEFYRNLSGQFDEPALTLHWRVEGRQEYSVLAFIPGSRPFDLFDPARKGRGKLYVRHVLIAQDAEILPGWLRFVRLVVDSADLPLNVSREMIQESPVFAAIKKAVTNRILQELIKLSENDAGDLCQGLGEFRRRPEGGALRRSGAARRFVQARPLCDIARSRRQAQPRRLCRSAAAEPDGDLLSARRRCEAAQRSPQLEGFRTRGIEVLLLSDPIDAFWVSTAVGFDGKPFKSVSQGAADIKSIEPEAGKKAEDAAPPSAQLATLTALMKQELAEVVEDVRASDRLSESPACLIAPEHGLDRRLERLLAEHGQLGGISKPVLEINPTHPLVAALAERIGQADKAALADIIWLLFEEARLMDGERPQDTSTFAARLTRVLLKAVSEKPAV